MRSRRRRRLVLLVVVAGIVAGVTAYRDRTLRRRSSEFLEQYGS